MGLSNKILLAAKAKGGTTGHWQGSVVCQLIKPFPSGGIAEYGYFPSGGIGSLEPLLETVTKDMAVAGLGIRVDSATLMLTDALIMFDHIGDSNGIKFEGLSKIILYSTTGGEPYVIDNPQDYWVPNAYNIFSDDLASWAYTNLTAGVTLEFTFELEWDE